MISNEAKTECAVCLGAHDQQIHAATLRIHTWWREVLVSRLGSPDYRDLPWPVEI